nr:hypothetical protein [Vibrio vulnificus]
MVTALCGSFCIACPRPLTRRYVLGRNYDLHDNGNYSWQGNRSSSGYC